MGGGGGGSLYTFWKHVKFRNWLKFTNHHGNHYLFRD